MSETVWIKGSHLHFENETYTGNLSARLMHADGKPYHTFRTASVRVEGENISFVNCTFENTAGLGEDVGQAIALYLDGRNISLEKCVLKGHQDTLFLAPVPEQEFEKDGFLGANVRDMSVDYVYYFKECVIYGGVDFVFGGGTAYFEKCTFISNEPGYVFAPSTPADVKKGFVVSDCDFICEEGIEDHSCYLARPWRENGMVEIINCRIGSHINPIGYDDWGKDHEKIRFYESGSEDTDLRADFVHIV